MRLSLVEDDTLFGFIEHMWAGVLPARSNNVEVYVSYLCDKLEGAPDCVIRTVRGVGDVLTQRQAPHTTWAAT